VRRDKENVYNLSAIGDSVCDTPPHPNMHRPTTPFLPVPYTLLILGARELGQGAFSLLGGTWPCDQSGVLAYRRWQDLTLGSSGSESTFRSGLLGLPVREWQLWLTVCFVTRVTHSVLSASSCPLGLGGRYTNP
jgi:hypothetical protein